MVDDTQEWHRHGLTVSTDRDRLDLEIIHGFLYRCYWVPGIPMYVVEKSVENSLCFGLYEGDAQIGFARVVTDYSRFAYLFDVFVVKEHRGKGYGSWLMECVMGCPGLTHLAGFTLRTRDAHTFYEPFGFERVEGQDSLMVLLREMSWLCPDLVED